MSSLVAHDHLSLNIELPWSEQEEQQKKYKRLLKKTIAPMMVFLLIFPFLPDFSPEEVIEDKIVAKVILEEVKVEVEPEPIELPKVVTKENRPLEEVAKRQPRAQPKAGTKIGTAELAALKQLSSFHSSVDLAKLQKKNVVQSNSGSAKRTPRALLGQDSASQKSGGVNVSEISMNARGVALADHQGADIESPVMAIPLPDQVEYQYDPDKSGQRDMESIRRVFEFYKGSVYSLYNKALRSDPELSGKFVFSLVITPDGSVDHVKVVASDLKNQNLEQEFLERIRSINFGSDNVNPTAVEYTYVFFAS